jgi:4-hydroxybenzoate polyprenyltransferase
VTTNTQDASVEQEVTINQKILALIRLARPQFLIAYLIVGAGALVIGEMKGLSINFPMAIFSVVLALVSAIGVHYRDEAGDWSSGYDIESGGMGVIREGTLSENTVRLLGRIISFITIAMGIFQAINLYIAENEPILFIIGIPIFIMIIFVNFLTEEIPLGHEIITTGSYVATFYWIFFAQGWSLTTPVFYFSVFIYLIVFALVPYQDIADMEVDSKTGKQTLTRKLGLDGVGHLSIFVGLFSLVFLYIALLS